MRAKPSLTDRLGISTHLHELVTEVHQEGHSLQTEPYPFSEMQLQNIKHCVLSQCSGCPKLQNHHLRDGTTCAQLPLNNIQTTLGPAKKIISTAHQ